MLIELQDDILAMAVVLTYTMFIIKEFEDVIDLIDTCAGEGFQKQQLITSMSSYVPGKSTIVRSSKVTMVTLMWLIPSMSSDVPCKNTI